MDAAEIAGGSREVGRIPCAVSAAGRTNVTVTSGRHRGGRGALFPDATVTDSRAGMGIGPSSTTMDQLTVGLSRVFARPVSSPEARYHQ